MPERPRKIKHGVTQQKQHRVALYSLWLARRLRPGQVYEAKVR